MKKCIFFITLVLIVAMSFSLVGCGKKVSSDGEQGGTKASEQTTSSKSLPDKLTNKEISVLVWTDVIKAEFDNAVKIMEEKYDATVNFTMTTSNEMETKAFAAMSAGEPFDCIYWSVSNMPYYAIKGIVQPIEPYFDLADPMWQEVIDSMDQFKYKGNYYGVSVGPEPLYLYFNKTMFENNGKKTPLEYYKEGQWNWETLRKLGMDLTQDTDKDGAIDQWGFFISSAEAWGLALANGADFVNYKDDGNIELNARDPKIVEALQFYQDGYIKDKYIGTGLKWQNDFPLGKIAMVGAKLAGVNRFAEANMKDEWDMAPFPPGPSGMQGVSPGSCGYWGISNGAKNPEGGAALLYLRQKTLENKAALDRCTDAQKELIYELRKKVKLPKYSGIGNMQKLVNQLWTKVSKEIPIMTAIDEHLPLLQSEIDLMMQDVK